MINNKRFLLFLICITCVTIVTGLTQEGISTNEPVSVNIPDEILSRIPADQIVQFVRCRERALQNNPEKALFLNVYSEIGIKESALSRIPEDQLFQFLRDRGYVELEISEHISFNSSDPGDFNNGPSPSQVFSILYLLLAIATFITILTIVLGFYRKRGDQQIVIHALDQGADIPYDLLKGNKRKSYMRNAIIFLVTGLGFLVAGTVDFFPIAFGIVPISIGVGMLMAALVVKD